MVYHFSLKFYRFIQPRNDYKIVCSFSFFFFFELVHIKENLKRSGLYMLQQDMNEVENIEKQEQN